MIDRRPRLLSMIVAVWLFVPACAGPPQRSTAPDAMPWLRLEYPGRASDTRAFTEDAVALILWPTGESPRFILFVRGSETVRETRRWEEYLAMVDALPRGSTVLLPWRCGAGFAPGMPGERREGWRRHLRERGLQPVAPEFGVCSCETSAVVVLTDR